VQVLRVLQDTRDWIESVVIGLELCPFAREPLRAGLVRIRVTDAEDAERLALDLSEELSRLDREASELLETTLLVHPRVLLDFEDFNRFLDVGDLLIAKLGLEGEIQIASFHPDYRFADASPDDVANATNQSPHPMLHLLREASIERARRSHPDPQGIPARNAQRLRSLGWDGVVRLRGRPRA
jgi:hypothetical protein